MDEQLCTEKWVERVAIVAASGELDMLTAPQLRDAVQSALEAHNQTGGTETRFAVVAEGSATSRPLKITGIADLIDLFSALDDAVDNFTA